MPPSPRDCPRCGQPIPEAAPGGECPVCLIHLSLDADGPGTEPTAAEVQAALPHLEVGGRVGRGGCGVVFRARHPALDREVAVKWLTADRAADPGFVERFVREARVLAKLDHPHVVRVYDCGEAGGSAFLVMEYMPGGSLRDRLADRSLTPADALRLVPQLCEAVGYAHDRGVIHRDIKPENVLLDAAGRVKVADFGLAKLCADDAGLTGSGERLGTARYMAPEQWADTAAVDHRADIYSLGVLFYELLTGDLPTPQYDPPSRRAGTDRRLDRVVSKSLRDRPSERYQRAAEIKTDVDRIAAHPRRRWPWLVLAGGTVAVVVIWASGGRQPPDPATGNGAPVAAGSTRGLTPPARPDTAESPLTSPDYDWTPPENLGPPVNTAHDEGQPCLSADGNTLLFQSDRPGGSGGRDLWGSRRRSAADPWGEPVNLGPPVNGPGVDEAPTLTADGRTLMFVSDRHEGTGTDIWVARRPAADAPWGEPERLPEPVNSDRAEYRPWLSADGLALTFSSLREPRDGLWVARRRSADDPFDAPVPYGRQSHLRSLSGPSFTADRRTMLLNRFNRTFPGDLLWLSRLDDPDEPFRHLRSFGPTVNGDGIDTGPVAAPDGRAVYFDSDRPGGLGERDIWLTRRVPKTR